MLLNVPTPGLLIRIYVTALGFRCLFVLTETVKELTVKAGERWSSREEACEHRRMLGELPPPSESSTVKHSAMLDSSST